MGERTWSYGDHASIVARPAGEGAVIEVTGELDLASAQGVHEAVGYVLEGDTGHVAFDLGQCTFIDSSGISALLLARRACVEAGRTLYLQAVGLPIVDVLEVTGVSALFGTAR